MGTHLRVLSKSYPMNTNMTGFGWFSKNLCVLVRWMKVASALVGLIDLCRVRPKSFIFAFKSNQLPHLFLKEMNIMYI